MQDLFVSDDTPAAYSAAAFDFINEIAQKLRGQADDLLLA
jgi:hypothetical protein